MNNNVFVGTEVKYLVKIESSGFDMARDDFEITLKKGSFQKLFHKSDLIEEIIPAHDQEPEQHNFYLCFDTTEFGPGNIIAIVKAYVPDMDFPDDLRTEVDKFDLLNPKGV